MTGNRLEFIVSLVDRVTGPVDKIINRLDKMTSGVTRMFGTAFKIASAAVTGFVGVSTNHLLDLQRQLDATSGAFNVNQQSMQKWIAAASTLDVEADKMSDIMMDINDKIGDFALTGGGGAKDIFDTLKLNIKDFKGLAPDQALLKIGAALDKSGLKQSEKVFLLEGLASDSSRLLPLLENNAAALNELGNLAQRSGAIISTADAETLRTANAEMGRMKLAFQGLSTQAGLLGARFIAAFGPRVASAISDIARWIGDTWESTSALRSGLLYLGTGAWNQLSAFASGIAEGFKSALGPVNNLLPPMDKFLRTVFAIGNELDDRTGTAVYWGRMVGQALTWLTAGLIAAKVAAIGLRIVMLGIRIVMAGIAAIQGVWNAALWAGRAAMVALRAVSLVGMLTLMAGRMAITTVATWAWTAASAAAGAASWLLAGAIAVLTSPITLIIAGLAALAAGAYYLYTHWGQVKAYLAETSWGSALLAVFDAISSPMQTFNSLVAWLESTWASTKASLAETTWGQMILGAINALFSPFETFKASVNIAKSVWDSIKGSLADTTWGQAIIGTIERILGFINKFKEGWASLKSAASEKISGAWGSIKAAVGIGGDAPQDGGARALGGTVLPGHFYRVAERGPELLQTMGQTYLMTGGMAGNIIPFPALAERTGSSPLENIINPGMSSVTSLSQQMREKSNISSLSREVRSLNVREMFGNATGTGTRGSNAARQQKTFHIGAVHIHTNNQIDPHELEEQLRMLG